MEGMYGVVIAGNQVLDTWTVSYPIQGLLRAVDRDISQHKNGILLVHCCVPVESKRPVVCLRVGHRQKLTRPLVKNRCPVFMNKPAFTGYQLVSSVEV
jgi:hypothetical protein